MVKKPGDYRWNDAQDHLTGKNDILVSAAPLTTLVNNWKDFPITDATEDEKRTILSHERTGGPIGNDNFIRILKK